MHIKSLSRLAFLSLCFTLFPVAAADAPAAQQDSLTQIINAKAPSWSLITRDVESRKVLIDAQKLADVASAKIMRIKLLRPEEMTFENTFGILDQYDSDFISYSRLVNQVSYIKDSPAIRAVVDGLATLRVNFVRTIIKDKEIWQALLTAAEQDWVKDLNAGQRRYMDFALNSFRFYGADLEPEQQQRLFELVEEIITLGNAFSKNVADANAAWSVLITDEAELDGMNRSWMSNAAHAAKLANPDEEKDQWLISSATNGDYVLYICHSRETRQKVWEAIRKSLTQPPYDNSELVKRTLALRQEQAKLLGYDHFADLVTSRYMMGSAEKALNFVDGLRDDILSIAAIDNMQIRESAAIASNEAQSDTLPALAPWDEFYHRLRTMTSPDDKAIGLLSAYLPVEQTLSNSLSYLGELFSLRFEKLETVYYASASESRDANLTEVPHPDILAYEVFDEKKGKSLGVMYLDLMQRQNKRPGAWTGSLREASGSDERLIIVTANFSSIKKDLKGLFSYGELRVFFHEMGHVLHMLLGDNDLAKNDATYAAWDFIETPSQAVERLVTSPDFLRRHAKHFISGDPIPDNIIKDISEIKNNRSLYDFLVNLTWAKIDLELHSDAERYLAGRSMDEYIDDVLRAEGLIGGEGPLSFELYRLSHCMAGGYAAGFYSYPWSEILAADIYSRFREEGADPKKVADELREKILSKGNSAPAEELYRDFMGRDPSYDAFLDELE